MIYKGNLLSLEKGSNNGRIIRTKKISYNGENFSTNWAMILSPILTLPYKFSFLTKFLSL